MATQTALTQSLGHQPILTEVRKETRQESLRRAIRASKEAKGRAVRAQKESGEVLDCDPYTIAPAGPATQALLNICRDHDRLRQEYRMQRFEDADVMDLYHARYQGGEW